MNCRLPTADCRLLRVAIDAQQEFRVHQHALERELDAGLEVTALTAAAVVELEQRLDVAARDRPAVRKAGHLRQDSGRAGSLASISYSRGPLRPARLASLAGPLTPRAAPLASLSV